MLIGRHGVGKTTIVKDLAEKLDVEFKYYSSATLDPYSELIGIPVPDTDHREQKNVDYFRPKDLNRAEFIFFDELNRVQNERVLNAVLEIVQFKTINGEPLPNLKMVWCAINPPGDYQVVELDPALEDRFHMYVKIQAAIDMDYMKTKMKEPIARVMKDWWDVDLSDDQKKILTPRRVEYIGRMIDQDIPWRDAIPVGTPFPIQSLEKRLSLMVSGKEEMALTKENILQHVDEIVNRLDKEPQLAIGLASVMSKFSDEELFACRDIFQKMSTELVNRVFENKFIQRQRVLKNLFTDAGIDIAKEYPKIAKALKPGVV
jgi:hypothetical protein